MWRILQSNPTTEVGEVWFHSPKYCKGQWLVLCIFYLNWMTVWLSMTDSVGHSHTYWTDIRRLQLLQGGPGAHSPSLTFQCGSKFGMLSLQERSLAICLCLNLSDVLLQTVTHRFWTVPETLGCIKDINCRWDHCDGPWEVHQPHCQYRERKVPWLFQWVNRGIPGCQWYGAEQREFGHQPSGTCSFLQKYVEYATMWYDLIWDDDMIWTW